MLFKIAKRKPDGEVGNKRKDKNNMRGLSARRLEKNGNVSMVTSYSKPSRVAANNKKYKEQKL